jgi:hypothetical protein
MVFLCKRLDPESFNPEMDFSPKELSKKCCSKADSKLSYYTVYIHDHYFRPLPDPFSEVSVQRDKNQIRG